MNNISFDNPLLLLLIIPLVALIVVPFCITVRKSNVKWYNVTACVLHTVMCVCIVFAISGMYYQSIITQTNVYVVADVSYSADRNLDKVDEYIGNIKKSLPKNSKMGVIGFGRNYAMLSDLGESVVSVKTLVEGDKPAVDQSATDVASAMRYAGNLFDEGVIKRIVVITDGAETLTTNDTVKVVNALKNDGVIIDAVYLDDNLTEDAREVQLDGVEATKSTYLNKKEEVNVLVRSNNPERTQGWVTLLCDGVTVARKTELFDKGLNVITCALPTDEAGDYFYTVRCEVANASDDTNSENNVYYFSQSVTDEVKVLFIGDSLDCIAGRRIYGTENVTYISDPLQIPLSIEELCTYDEIAVSNFDFGSWGSGSAFLNNLQTAVSQFGKTLTTYGNTFIQNNLTEQEPNEALAMLSDMLPVNVGDSDMDDRIIVMLLDISTSEGLSDKLAVAKETATGLLNVFGENDTVMIVGFSQDEITYCQPTKLKSRKVIVDAINKITVRNGTLLSSAMQTAYDTIKRGGFHNREVLIISDGIVDAGEATRCNALASEMSGIGSNINISAIGLFTSSKEEQFLKGLVENPNASGNGYYQSVKNYSEVEFTLQSVGEKTAEYKKDGQNFSVKINRSGEKLVEGITSVESVRGFWASTEKMSATTVLSASYYRDAVTEIDAPLFSYWTYGNGKVATVTTDIASEWIAYWGSSSSGGKVLANVKAATLPDERINVPLTIKTELTATGVEVAISTAATYSNSSLTVTLVMPDGYEITKPLHLAGENYITSFDTDITGVYKLSVNYGFGLNPAFNEDEEEGIGNEKYLNYYNGSSAFSISYYPEYDAFASYPVGNLYRLVTTGVISEDGFVDMDMSDVDHVSFRYEFTIPLMIFAAVLFVADIVIRKLRWKDIVTFFRLHA